MIRGGAPGAILGLLLFSACAGVLLPACRSEVASPQTGRLTPADVPASGPISIALAGDLSFQNSLIDETAGFDAVTDLVRGATLAFANLEVNLLDPTAAREAALHAPPRWVFGAAIQARELRRLGFDLVSLANNHATDFGADGLSSTIRALDEAGILHAGAGDDLAAAQLAAVTGHGARRVALLAVSASLAPATRASRSQPDIRGRPGANPLQFAADITVDAPTFQTLKLSVVQLNAGPSPGDDELTLFGTRIRKGDRTHVDFLVNAQDEEAMLGAVRAARKSAEVVVVSIHSHEPINASDRPAEFVRRVAHDLVDAGAQVVVGHGPHQLRGLEVYNGAAIFYSLGNFMFQTEGLDFRAADAFDAGHDLYSAVLGTPTEAGSPRDQLDRDVWWQSVLAVPALDGGRLRGLKIYPLDLGVDEPVERRGIPRLATGDRASAILRHFAEISRQFQVDGPGFPAVGPGGALEVPITGR